MLFRTNWVKRTKRRAPQTRSKFVRVISLGHFMVKKILKKSVRNGEKNGRAQCV